MIGLDLILQLGCWLSLAGLIHTYLIYPALTIFLARGRQWDHPQFRRGDALPYISVLIAVYNEEKVIEAKLQSLRQQDYPSDRIQIFLGSDASTDRTNEIVERYSEDWDSFHFSPFSLRRGKPGVLNRLAEIALAQRNASPDHVLLLTDANVILGSDTIWHLIKHFKDPQILLVDAHMQAAGLRSEGISRAEDRYLSREVALKHREGLIGGSMIGPFGGCYALRSDVFEPVPEKFLVDDFFLGMKVFEKGGKAINELEAVCTEESTHSIWEEYKRKARISAGNFQNMAHFSHLWWPPVGWRAFALFSHKVLRWIGP
ncbi:MAG: glycosyltransferase, partial [Saprospiraceae bacterium]|nr:glycosyltransferase [Saprospiraceae bacterium]